MMKRQTVSQALYERYIVPTKTIRQHYIGVEIELPIVNLKQEAVDFHVVYAVTDHFLNRFGFVPTGRDSDGHIYAAKHRQTGDILSYDCSYNNLELSFGIASTIHEIHDRFRTYYQFLQDQFNRHYHALTGMGINPYRSYNRNVPIKNERYQMLFHHLGSYRNYFQSEQFFHRHPSFGAFSCASQVQLDVNEADLIKTIRAHSRLEPIKALLFSNSVLWNDREDLLCCRDMMWENSTHGINPHNIGMYDTIPETLNELQSYIESESLYCVERDGKYVNFAPVNIMEYFAQPSVTGEYIEDGEYKTMKVIPELDDVKYLRTFKFEDLTFRGTIEYRSSCCQPVSDAMCIAAFHTGLNENIDALDQLLEYDRVLYHRGYNASELRKLFVRRKHPSLINDVALYDLAEQTVDLAASGLQKRGFGEERYLAPLYRRIELRENPAEHLLKAREAGRSMEALIREYGTLS